MPTITTTIDISASAEIVWRVLSDFSSYPKWNPYIREVRGNLKQGQRLKLRVRLTPKRSRWVSTRVLKIIPAAELHWRTRRLSARMFASEHGFIIVPNGVKGVHFIQRKHFSGVLAPLILAFIGKTTQVAFERMNAALKKVAEAKR